MTSLFNDRHWLDPRDWNIYIGLSNSFRQAEVPNEFKNKERAKQLGVTATYGVGLVARPLTVSRASDGWVGIDFPESLLRQPLVPYPSFILKRRADLVWDDEGELSACQFPDTRVATALSRSVRQQAYGGALMDVLPPQAEIATAFTTGGSAFLAAAAEKATYDPSDGRYYPKWIKPKPSSDADRRFGFDALSDHYLKLNYLAYELQKSGVYVSLIVREHGINLLARLYRDESKPGRELRYEALNVQGLPLFGDFFGIISEYLRRAPGRTVKKPRADAWFYYSIGGPDQMPAYFARTEDVAGLSLKVLEQVVDPQYMVQSTRGRAWDDVEKERKNWTTRAWLKELVRLRFSEQWLWFRRNPYGHMFYSPDRDKLFLNPLKEQIKQSSGSIKERLQEFVTAANQDKDLYLIPRGTKFTRAKRVVGSDDAYVYLYDNDRHLLTRLPMHAFWEDRNLALMSADIFKNTQGMIPISKAIVWGGTFVMGWAVVGTEQIAALGRKYVVEKLTSEAVSEAIERAIFTLRDRLLLSLLGPIMALFPKEWTSGTMPINHAFHFFKGFIQGYTNDALAAMFGRWSAIARLEPAAYRTLKLMMKVEGVLRMADEKISAIKAYVDRRKAELLLHRFVAVLLDLTTGFIGFVHALKFLEYDQVKDLLGSFSDLTGEAMPTKAEWDKFRHAHMLETFRQYHEGIVREQADLAEIYADVKHSIDVVQRAVKIAEVSYILHVASGGALVALVMFVLAKAVKSTLQVTVAGAGFGIALAAVSKKFRESMLEALADAASAIEDNAVRAAKFVLGRSPTVERTERLGQMIGQAYGGLTLDRGLLGKKESWAESFKGGKMTGRILRGQVELSLVVPILRIVLFNYVYMVEKVVADSRKSWAEFEEKLEEILIGDGKFSDIIEDDRGLTPANVLRIVSLVDTTIQGWLTQLSQDPELATKIGLIAEKLKSVTPQQLPTLRDLREGKFAEGGWSREAILFVLLSHLQASLRFIAQSIEAMHTPITADDPQLSIAFLLGLLGFQQGEAEVMEVLDRDFAEVFEAPDTLVGQPTPLPAGAR
jgi:hypothetical protein